MWTDIDKYCTIGYFCWWPPRCLPQTKQRWTAAPALRTRSSTTCWSSCSPDTVRWRSESPAPSASTTTSSWSSSVDTPPASTAARRSKHAPSAGRPSASGSSYLSERLRPPHFEATQRRWAGLGKRKLLRLKTQWLFHLPARHHPSDQISNPIGCFNPKRLCHITGCYILSFPSRAGTLW